MLVKVMSVFNCDADELFKEVRKTKSLIYMSILHNSIFENCIAKSLA